MTKTKLWMLGILLLMPILVLGNNYIDNTEAEFNLGTYVNTTFNSSPGAVILGAREMGNQINNSFPNWRDGNVLLMHMDEVSGTVEDFSIFGNNGTATGVTYGVSGQVASAIDVDGGANVDIEITDDVSLNLSGRDFTIGLWLNMDDTGTSGRIYEVDGVWNLAVDDVGSEVETFCFPCIQ